MPTSPGDAPPPGGIVPADYAITVLGVDTAQDVVYVDDSACRNGKGIAVKMDVFMSAWSPLEPLEPQTITAHVTPPQRSTIAA
jgi:hypothetical protein